MTQESAKFQIVTLQRADQATDLWPAIEAAQYGHVVQRDGPEAEAEAGPSSAFVAALSEVVEAWEAATPATQGALIRKLDTRLAMLLREGDHVHWGIVNRVVSRPDGEPVEIPIAILRVGSRPEASVEVAIPRDLTAVDEDRTG